MQPPETLEELMKALWAFIEVYTKDEEPEELSINDSPRWRYAHERGQILLQLKSQLDSGQIAVPPGRSTPVTSVMLQKKAWDFVGRCVHPDMWLDDDNVSHCIWCNEQEPVHDEDCIATCARELLEWHEQWKTSSPAKAKRS